MNYTLSYYKPQTTTVLVRRPWWAFWRHDTLEHRQTLVRFVVAGLGYAGHDVEEMECGDEIKVTDFKVSTEAPNARLTAPDTAHRSNDE